METPVYPSYPKLSKTVGVLSKIRYFVNSDILVMLYYALIFSFLNYGIETLGLTYPSYLKPISIIQKKCIRIMTYSEPQSHSEPLLRSLNLLKFTDLITFQILNFIHKWAHNLLPPLLPCMCRYSNGVVLFWRENLKVFALNYFLTFYFICI